MLTAHANTIENSISEVYLTDELKFSKETMASVNILSSIVSIFVAILSGYLASSKPFTFMYKICLLCVIANSYAVLVFIYNFPRDTAEHHTVFNLCNLTVVTLGT